MKVALIHLSDIHFKENDNPILEKKKKLFDALKNNFPDCKYIFIVLSGDIAYSGKEEEYIPAMLFIDYLKTELRKYTKKEIKCCIVPGNHDCDYAIGNGDVRDSIINNIQKSGSEGFKAGFIETCCEVQKNFFTFREICQDTGEIIYEDNLLLVSKFLLNNKTVIVYCYNTSWMSVKNDGKDKLYFPIETFDENLFEVESDLSISILHHPFDWQLASNMRAFQKKIENSSDIIFSGHEHIPGKKVVDYLDGHLTEYIEGDILQSSSSSSESGFNLVVIDFENKKQKIFQYKWNGKYYSNGNIDPDWVSYIRGKNKRNKKFIINQEFDKTLNDTGMIVHHPQKQELFLYDLFVWPDLRNLEISARDEKLTARRPLNSKTLINNIKRPCKLLFVGPEKSGKTTFCKKLYNFFYETGLIPIFIDGYDLNRTSKEDIEKIITKSFSNQYDVEYVEAFLQYDNSKKVLIIDDFDSARINYKYKATVLGALNDIYSNIIITANDFYAIEEIIYDRKPQNNVFDDYQQYEFLPFGHFLRNKLLEKWNCLGVEETIEDTELIKKNDDTKRILDTIIGKNFVPSHPFFLLVILQSIEIGTPHSLRESSFGYYYDFLITQALGNINAKNEEIDAYFNYISAFAFQLFEKKTREATEDEFKSFHNLYCSEYDINPNLNEYIKSLTNAGIIKRANGNFKFKYKYLFYYFVAKYFSTTIDEENTKEHISKLCNKIHLEEFANIIMFLTHLSKDKFVLDEVLNKAKISFSELDPIQLENDVDAVNELIEKIPDLIVQETTPQEIREKKYRERDEIENNDEPEKEETTEYNFDDESPVDFISKLNTSFKSIEIIGQILKNYYGSIKADRKVGLCEEAYFSGLRSLNFFYDVLLKHNDFIIERIQYLLKKKKIVDETQIEEVSKKYLFSFFDTITYFFIKKLSSSLGNENLKETYKKIVDKNDFASVNLIDISIKLQFFEGYPISDIDKLASRFKNNSLATILLKKFVIDYLYMYPIKYRDKQRICERLGLTMNFQRQIESDTSRRLK